MVEVVDMAYKKRGTDDGQHFLHPREMVTSNSSTHVGFVPPLLSKCLHDQPCISVCSLITFLASSHTSGIIQPFSTFSLDLEALRVYNTETLMKVVDVDWEEDLIQLFQTLQTVNDSSMKPTSTENANF